MYNFRTDLAVERNDILTKTNNQNNVDGVEVSEEQISEFLKVSKVEVKTKEGEEAIGKPIGTYTTLDIKDIRLLDDEEKDKIIEVLKNKIQELINKYVKKEESVLVVGLGNLYVTPDSLGPKVINEIEVTRHVIKYMPQYVEEGTREISAMSPGVLGTTGIETLEVIESIVQKIQPKLLIVIDALAARSIERISSSIQLSDTGIVPGAGVGNTRKELSKNTLNIPVVAIGIPTVVESAVLVNDSLDILITKLQEEAKSNEYLNELKSKDNYEEIKDALSVGEYNMIVTPKEIDEMIEDMKDILAGGINQAI